MAMAAVSGIFAVINGTSRQAPSVWLMPQYEVKGSFVLYQ
jgi:hypothetical protein